MSRWRDEIKADVDPGVVVVKQRALDFQLFLQIIFKLRVDVVHNGLVTAEQTRERSLVYRLIETVQIFI